MPLRLVVGFGAAVLAPLFATVQAVPFQAVRAQAVLAQVQTPIFGCRHAISCRNSPTGLSALNDLGASGLLLGGSIRWGPGFHFGLVTPILKIPAAEPAEAIELHRFHLRDVTLLPTPDAAPTPTPASTPTPPPAREDRED